MKAKTIKLIITMVIILTFMSGCSFIDALFGSSKISSYIEVKRSYVNLLEKAIFKTPNSEKGVYRLIAIVGPQWRIGEVVDINNPLNIITDKCIFDKNQLPEFVKWSNLPGISEEKKINFFAGLPKSILKFIGKDNVFHIKFDLINTGNFSLRSLESQILNKEVFENGITDECRELAAREGGFIIRGVVKGKENFKSGREFDSTFKLQTFSNDIINLSYNSKGDFELEDKQAIPKMFFITVFKKHRNDSVVSRHITKNEIEKLENILLSRQYFLFDTFSSK